MIKQFTRINALTCELYEQTLISFIQLPAWIRWMKLAKFNKAHGLDYQKTKSDFLHLWRELDNKVK